MEVMLDTNVLFSAIFFPSERMNGFFSLLAKNHSIVLCSYSLEELYRVTKRKLPQRLSDIEIFLLKLPYRFVYTPRSDLVEDNFNLHDPADYPIILSAMIAGVDILITGDHDFDDVKLEKPEIMTPSDFINAYSV